MTPTNLLRFLLILASFSSLPSKFPNFKFSGIFRVCEWFVLYVYCSYFPSPALRGTTVYIILSVSEEIDNLSIFCGLHFTYVIFYLRYFLLLSSVGFYLTTLVFCRSFFLLNFGKYHNFVFNKSESFVCSVLQGFSSYWEWCICCGHLFLWCVFTFLIDSLFFFREL